MASPLRPFAVVPGLALVFLVVVLALVGARLASPLGIGALALGLFLGLVVGNVGRPAAWTGPGVRHAASRFLALAVVFLGLRISFSELAGLGLPLGIAAGVVVGGVVLALVLGRLFGVPARLAALIGAGTGVCGLSAIAALRPVVGAREAETAYAAAAVAVLGSAGLVFFPLVQLAWHPLDPAAFGVLAGGTLHSVPQAVGAGFAGGGEAAGTLATVVKLSRVVLLAPLVLILAAFWPNNEAAHRRLPRLPVEVWGFLLFVLLGNLLPVPDLIRAAAARASDLFLLVALTALGLSTRFSELRAAGARPMVVALIVWAVLVIAVVALLFAAGW